MIRRLSDAERFGLTRSLQGRVGRADRRSHRRSGRPPSGARPGEKVSDYPQLSVRIPPEMKRKLEVLSMLQSKPQWRIVIESVEYFIRSLPESEQGKVQAVLSRRP
jgi:hypothetical protein